MQTHRQAQNIHKNTHINNIFKLKPQQIQTIYTKKDQLAHQKCASWQYQELCEITWMERDNPRPCCKE